jgi:large subunit ribosomal protein L9
MEVILKEDVAKLGSRGDVVKVAEGYGRNFLLPHRLAIEANEGNKKVIEQMRAASVRRSAKEKAQAEELSKQFDGVSLSFQRSSAALNKMLSTVTFRELHVG